MNEAIQELARALEQPYNTVAEAKERTGRRVIGCFPLYVPHELVHAAGMLPVDIYGGSGEMTVASEYLQNIVCYPVRAAVEQLLTGELDVLDGAIYAGICTGTSTGAGVVHNLNLLPFFRQLSVPHRPGGQYAIDFLQSQIERLRSALEAFGGRTISADTLRGSIALYNRSRTLLGQLAAVSRERPAALSFRELAVVRAASSFLPRDEYVPLLSGLLDALAAAPAGASAEKVNLLLTGSLCDLPQFAILSMLEEAGGAIVDDDSPLGRRLEVPVPQHADPVAALAQRYANVPPCPTRYYETVDANAEYLIGLARSGGAQGVLFLRPQYCDLAGMDYPLLIGRLEAAGLPTLSLDLNGRETASGQVETRLQAFVEMLRR